ncbi:MAG: SHOCT domain-containing protein [Coriobacteriales bacterium]|nr:SHOCT domain-containing protein [Coriobacteriales bacterium]
MWGYGGQPYDSTVGGYGWFGGILMFIFMLAILIGAVLLVVWAVRAVSGHGGGPGGTQWTPPGPREDDAIAIARKRLASGEITAEQFEEIKRALGG